MKNTLSLSLYVHTAEHIERHQLSSKHCTPDNISCTHWCEEQMVTFPQRDMELTWSSIVKQGNVPLRLQHRQELLQGSWPFRKLHLVDLLVRHFTHVTASSASHQMPQMDLQWPSNTSHAFDQPGHLLRTFDAAWAAKAGSYWKARIWCIVLECQHQQEYNGAHHSDQQFLSGSAHGGWAN